MPTQVDYDPFATAEQPTGGVPVDYDPFAAAKPEGRSAGEGLARGLMGLPKAVAEMLTNFGFVPAYTPAIGSKQSMAAAGPMNQVPGDNGAAINREFAADEADYIRRQGGGIDLPRLAGSFISLAPIAAMLPGAAPTLLGVAARGVATGAATGALDPVASDKGDFWQQKAKNTAIGAATGGIAAPAVNMLGRVISPKIDEGVKYLMDRGVRVRPGQIIGRGAATVEDKAQSIPIVGDAIAASQRRAVEDFNKAAYNEILSPLGKKFTGEAGRDGIGAVEKQLNESYTALLPNLQFKADQKFVAEFKKIAGMAQSLPPDKHAQFEKIMTNELIPRFSKTGQMDGLTFKQMETELGNFARNYRASPSPDDRSLASAVDEILSSARGALERSNPKLAPELKKLNRSWAMFTRVQDAASRLGGEEGVFTPAHLLSAVRSGDKSVRKGAFARGDALLQQLAETGKNVLGSKYPDSGTAGRMANIGGAAALLANPVLTIGGAAVGAAPYTEFGQKLATAILAKRPSWAPQVRGLLDSVSSGSGVAFPALFPPVPKGARRD